MEQVQENSNIATITKTTTNTAKDYQKYFDSPKVVVKSNQQIKAVAYNRAKVVLVTAYCILALMIGLAVANFVIISSMNSNLETAKVTYKNEIAINEEYSSDVGSAMAKDLEERLKNAGYVEGNDVDQILIVPVNLPAETNEIQEQTNWFNEFTKFISQVFGG